jgi:hypothetical protein
MPTINLVPIGASALRSSKLIPNAKLKVYPGYPHGMATTHPDQIKCARPTQSCAAMTHAHHRRCIRASSRCLQNRANCPAAWLHVRHSPNSDLTRLS